MNNSKKLIAITILSFLALILLVLSPEILLLGSGVGIWYYIKKSPNKPKRNIAITLAVLSFLVVGIMSDSDSESASNKNDTTVESINEEDIDEVVAASDSEDDQNENEETQIKKEEEEQREKEEQNKKEEEQRKIEEEQRKKEEQLKIEEEEQRKKEEVAAEIKEVQKKVQSSTPSVPSGEEYVQVNNNIPLFTNEDITSTEPWESYGKLDSLGRVTVANAILGVELMPPEQRGDISGITPTGWNQAEYEGVSWLYHRSHLIGFQLTGENANPNNLMTGTNWFNVSGMLPFENFVANYIETTENHVRYRITPHFEGNNLLASGIFMEGFSIEDNGDEIQFHIYVPNIQPGVNINYKTGESWVDAPKPKAEEKKVEKPAPAPTPAPKEKAPAPQPATVTFKNCTAAREAGAAPVSKGDPGYGTHLDRDGDGIGCE